MTGYLHPFYAESLKEFGAPRFLPNSKGWVLERQIPDSSYKDAIGCYPLFACQDWSKLQSDLDRVEDGVVSLSVVTDPFGEFDEALLRRCFKDRVSPFKEHFVINLQRPLQTFVHPHHRRNSQKALQDMTVERCTNAAQFIDDWTRLYANLIERHGIKGMTAFSRSSFSKQLEVPGIEMFRAIYQGSSIGMSLWYVQGDVGYYHLAAYSEQGYKMRASFALFWTIIEHFAASGLKWLNLGAGAGIKSDGTDGLTRFKRGWSNDTRTVYLCGRIFDEKRYREIMKAKGVAAETNYFPAYRKGEFG